MNKVSALAGRRNPVGTLSRATGGRPERSARYRSIYGPRGWGSELRATFDVGGSTWGAAMLLREQGRPDFTADEARLVTLLSAHLAHGLRTAVLTTAADDEEQTPGVVIVDARTEVELVSAAAQRWLEELADEPVAPLPASVLSVANRARTVDGDADPRSGADARASPGRTGGADEFRQPDRSN